MWWPWGWTTQTSLRRTACFGECIPPWGHTIVFRKGLISWVPSQRLSTAGGPELAMAAQGKTSALSKLYPGSQHQLALNFLERPCSLRLFLPNLPSLPLSFMVSDWPGTTSFILFISFFFKFNFVYLFICLFFGRAESRLP